MQYIPWNSALLAQETLFLTQKGTFFAQRSPRSVQIVTNLNLRQNSVCSRLKFSSESKLFGGGPLCLCTTSATLLFLKPSAKKVLYMQSCFKNHCQKHWYTARTTDHRHHQYLVVSAKTLERPCATRILIFVILIFYHQGRQHWSHLVLRGLEVIVPGQAAQCQVLVFLIVCVLVLAYLFVFMVFAWTNSVSGTATVRCSFLCLFMFLWYLSWQLVQCQLFVFVTFVKISNAVSVFVFLEWDSKCKITIWQLQVQPIRARLDKPARLTIVPDLSNQIKNK